MRKNHIDNFDWDDESSGDDLNRDVRSLKKKNINKDTHSEIERKRREKMLSYIIDLRDSVPACSMIYELEGRRKNKPDKLTILQMATEHMRDLAEESAKCDDIYRPGFLSPQQLKHLILAAADGFLFIVDCETEIITYVSDSISSILNWKPNEWIGIKIQEKIHSDDIENFLEKTRNVETENVYVDLKSGNIKKYNNHASNSKINFICRMKFGDLKSNFRNRYKFKNCLGSHNENDSYAVVHCTGFIRTSNITDLFHTESNSKHNEIYKTYMIAIGRLQLNSIPEIRDLSSSGFQEFITRHSLNGAFLFVDQRVIEILGYLPVDLLGKNPNEFVHPEDKIHVCESFKQVIDLNGQFLTIIYRFKEKNRKWKYLKTSMHAFINPYSEEIEFILATNFICRDNVLIPDDLPQNGREMDTQFFDLINAKTLNNQNVQPRSSTNADLKFCEQNCLSNNETKHNNYDSTPSSMTYNVLFKKDAEGTTSGITYSQPLQTAWSLPDTTDSEEYQFTESSSTASSFDPTHLNSSSCISEFNLVNIINDNVVLSGCNDQQFLQTNSDLQGFWTCAENNICNLNSTDNTEFLNILEEFKSDNIQFWPKKN